MPEFEDLYADNPDAFDADMATTWWLNNWVSDSNHKPFDCRKLSDFAHGAYMAAVPGPALHLYDFVDVALYPREDQ